MEEEFENEEEFSNEEVFTNEPTYPSRSVISQPSRAYPSKSVISQPSRAYPSKFYQPSSQQILQVGQLSEEELRQRCEQADNSVLINMARQHEKIYNICYNTLRNRGLLGTVQSPPVIQSSGIPPQMMSSMQRRYQSQM